MPRWNKERRAEIAAEYDGYASDMDTIADGLSERGHERVASDKREQAGFYRNVAADARESSAALNANPDFKA